MAINQEYYGFTPTKYVTTGAAGGGVGSAGDPWTLAEAMTSAVAGDIVAIAAGVYVGSSTRITRNNLHLGQATQVLQEALYALWRNGQQLLTRTDLTDIRCGNTDAVATEVVLLLVLTM